MATGLEALGAASAVVQLIAFAGSLVSLSFKIYDGIPTPENELEEYSNKMMEAARRVQSRGAQVPQGTQRPGHCDSTTTAQGFRSLEADVQNLILKIAEGHKRVEQLVSIEAQATRDAINTHVTSELKALEIKKISDNQRQRLLKSLKPEEIRERYNAVLPSSDACFERVFASFERVCRKDPEHKAWKGYEQAFGDHNENESHENNNEAKAKKEVDEIGLIWECFSTWLQSDDKLFWIRGKPGSGKSTLIKFVIENNTTKRLLDSRHPNTRILSHFFWKIGNEPQNSIRGLLCSLLHDLLVEDDDAIDRVLKEFKFSESKDFYKEWSSQEAEKVLCFLLDASAHPACIFVDGLDEISDKDGYQALLDVIQRFAACRGVKVCVSSRPETELVRRLENVGVHNLRLDYLTKPEMAVYVRKEFGKLPRKQSADLPLEQFTTKLLVKAQGVFLWLALASKSVTNGILNGDDQKTLSRRLEELPDELESLYQTMWKRLNGSKRVYRETAARSKETTLADEYLKLFKCWLNLANTYYRGLEVMSDCRYALINCNRLYDKRADMEAILATLRTIKDLHEVGALIINDALRESTLTFPCLAAFYLDSFDDFIISSFMPTPSSELAANSLHELAFASQCMRMSKTSVRIIRVFIELGGDTHVAKRSILSLEVPGHEIRTIHTTAFELLLSGACDPPHGDARYDNIMLSLEVIEILVQTCPDLHRRVILFLGEYGGLLHSELRGQHVWVAVEVDLQFLIKRLLAIADLENIPAELTSRTRELAASVTRPYARARHIVRRRGKDPGTYCYRILDQESCLDIIDSLGYRQKYIKAVKALQEGMYAMRDPIDSSTHPESSFPSECFKEVPIEEEMDMLIQEGIGICREDVNIG
ncbi:related to small s protein [Fusarium fujikuroi]|nr:related to small s protein [Fusarium fujikuroi]